MVVKIDKYIDRYLPLQWLPLPLLLLLQLHKVHLAPPEYPPSQRRFAVEASFAYEQRTMKMKLMGF
mgnify:CR=1 FL=1